MKIVIVTLLITIPTLLFAEKKTIIEPAIMECQYDHIIVQDTLNRSHVMKDRMILRIGKNVSQFYSWYTLQGDSMWTDPRGRKIAAVVHPARRFHVDRPKRKKDCRRKNF